jgi:hypothetical protein
MVPIEMRLRAERRMRQILFEEQVAQPDVVYYGDSRIVFYWYGRSDAVIVEVTDDGQIGESRLGEPPAGATAGANPEAADDELDDLLLF